MRGCVLRDLRARVITSKADMRNRLVAAGVVLLVAATTACAEPLEFPDWTTPVPEGTPIIEHAAVPDEDRSRRIQLERDLVLGGDPGNPDATFFRPRDVAVDAQGRIYVLDQGNYRVQVFDADGRFMRTLGREGQGPGEFQYPLSLAVGDDRLLVVDGGNARVGIWDLDGTHIGDVGIERAGLLGTRADLFPDASILIDYADRQSLNEATGKVVRLYWESGRMESFAEVTAIVRIPFSESRSVGDGLRIDAPHPAFAMTPAGDFYVTPTDEYQVVAMNEIGEPRWALRVAHAKVPFSDAYLEAWIQRLREVDPDVTIAHLEPDRPDFFPAVDRILTDGRRRLYIVPFWRRTPGATREEIPVDVYAPDGARLMAGWMPDVEWHAAQDDLVYAIETDPASGEELVVRYRLGLPIGS